MEPPRSADELLASTLRTGDVVVFNRYCRSLAPHRAALCLASKYGLSGDGRGCWDHAALVVRDRRTDVAYLLEGGAGAVTMRTYEERMGEFADATEAVLLRAGAEASDAAAAGSTGCCATSCGCGRRPTASTRRARAAATIWPRCTASSARSRRREVARRADGDADAGCNLARRSSRAGCSGWDWWTAALRWRA